MKKVVLFDMDGTLTPPRKKMTWEMANKLSDLQKENFEIGIVTGSDMDYLVSQCDVMFDLSPVDFTSIHYLPCNGTKYYRYKQSDFEPIYESDMKREMGRAKYEEMIRKIFSLQNAIANSYIDMPLTGNFLSYRGSMLNWCPIGRSATDEERSLWYRFEKRHEIRNTWFHILRQSLNQIGLEDIIIKLGGETSFDIYPAGWDKTYAFRNFNLSNDSIYFVGDRCQRYVGNDYEAYILAGDKGYSTVGPEQTMTIIDEIIENERKS